METGKRQAQTAKESAAVTEHTLHMKDTKWEQLSSIYPHIHPFRDAREFLSVGPEDFVVLRERCYQMTHNSFLLHGYYNYRHLLLLRQEAAGQAKYYIGVPGNFYEREKQVARMFGFESFEGAREPAWEGDFGYADLGGTERGSQSPFIEFRNKAFTGGRSFLTKTSFDADPLCKSQYPVVFFRRYGTIQHLNVRYLWQRCILIHNADINMISIGLMEIAQDPRNFPLRIPMLRIILKLPVQPFRKCIARWGILSSQDFFGILCLSGQKQMADDHPVLH